MKINPIMYLLGAVAVLVILFFAFKPKGLTQESQNEIQTREAVEPSPLQTSKRFEINIINKKIETVESVIKVQEGDEVELTIVSDEPEEFHLHGYDLSAELDANTPQNLNFKADKTGRFPFELELSQTQLGAIEVLPN